MWIMNSIVMVNGMKDQGDMLDLWLNSTQSHAHLLDFWNKLLEVVDDSSTGHKRTFLEHSTEFSKP